MKALLGVSERRACRVLGHPRSTQRYEPKPVEDEKALTEEIVALASPVRQVRLPQDHRSSEASRLASEPQACGEDMAT